MTSKCKTLLATFSLLMLVACAPAQDVNGGDNDPLEPLNRKIFAFNEVVDGLILKPAAVGYRTIVPEFARKGVNNFLTNLTEPVTMVSALLQADPQRAFTAMWRFIINTTLGFGGVYDFAGDNTELKHRREDFGQTFGVWGAGSGPYIVLPILGPSSARDVVGKVADVAADPFTWMWEQDESIKRAMASGLNEREKLLDVLDDVYATSLDPYATIRSAYLQRREAEVSNRGDAKAGQ